MLKRARSMIIKTLHGEIETPNMAFVATHGRIKKPFMTDSGGFQVFSLGWGKLKEEYKNLI